MALWNLAARDELAVQPASRHVADLLLVACSHYVDLTALQTAFMKQLRQFYSLYADAGCVYGQGAQHRFLGPMCCDVHKRHSPSRAHICGGGESGLDPRGVDPPSVALTPSHAPQDLR